MKNRSNFKRIIYFLLVITLIPLCSASIGGVAADTADEQAAAADKSNLNIISANNFALYMNVELPTVGPNGSQISWRSSNEDYVSIQKIATADTSLTGVVNRPAKGEGNVPIVLTATITKGSATETKDFEVSVRQKNPLYEENFQGYLNKVSDTAVSSATGETFRGVDLPDGLPDWNYDSNIGSGPDFRKYFDRRIRSLAAGGDGYIVGLKPPVITAVGGSSLNISWSAIDGADYYNIYRKAGSIKTELIESNLGGLSFNNFNLADGDYTIVVKSNDNYMESKSSNEIKVTVKDGTYTIKPNEENLAFWMKEHTPYGGGTTYETSWKELIDPDTGKAPEGIVILNMDVFVNTGNQKLSLGLANSKPSQMARFSFNNTSKTDVGGTFRYWSGAAATQFDYKGGNYKFPMKVWRTATIVANSTNHTWDLYYDGVRINSSALEFRNAEDFVSNIEVVFDRSYSGGDYYFDNFYVENITSDMYSVYYESFKIDKMKYSNAPYAVNNSVDPNNVTGTFDLIVNGDNGIRLQWISGDPSVIEIVSQQIGSTTDSDLEERKKYPNYPIDKYPIIFVNRAVVKPDNYTGSDKKVTLTAYFNLGSQSTAKTFDLTVPKTAEPSDLDKAKIDLNAITAVTDNMVITTNQNLELPKVGSKYGSNIVWTSNNAGIISETGVVNVPSTAVSDRMIALIAKATNNTGIATKTYNITVKPKSYSTGSSGAGGSVSLGGNPVAVTPAPMPTIGPGGLVFNDISDVKWAYNDIVSLANKGIINGYGNGNFGPNDSITREGFVKIVMDAFGLAKQMETVGFADVQSGSWYTNQVNTAMALGLITGKGDGTFGVGENISRQDMAVICYRILNYLGKGTNDSYTSAFMDESQISDYARVSVFAMEKMGIITGDDKGAFNPFSNATRAEVAVITSRMLKK